MMCHIQRGLRLCLHGCPCQSWWFSVKQWPNYSYLWPVRPVLCTLVQCLIAFCSRPETASGVISSSFVEPVVFDKHVKFRLNRSPEIVPEAVGCGILDVSWAITSGRKQLMTSYLCGFRALSVWVSWQNLVIQQVKRFSKYRTTSLCDGRRRRRRTTNDDDERRAPW